MGYKDIEIDPAKDPEDYTYHERRSELLQFAIEAGHPDMLSRQKFAERYDVAPSTITRDIQALRDDIHEDLSEDAELISSIIYRKAIREKADRGEYMEAVEILESWNEWLFDTGQQERAPDRMEMDLDASIEKDERKALVGVDLTQFEGVDPDQMVGLELEDPDAADGDADDVEIPLEDTDE